MPGSQQKKDARKIAQREAGGAVSANPVYALLEAEGTRQNTRSLNAPPKEYVGETFSSRRLRPLAEQAATDPLAPLFYCLLLLAYLGVVGDKEKSMACHSG